MAKTIVILSIIYLVLAAYLLEVLILQDLVDLNQTTVTWLTVGMLTLVLLPIAIPVILIFFLRESTGGLEPSYKCLIPFSPYITILHPRTVIRLSLKWKKPLWY